MRNWNLSSQILIGNIIKYQDYLWGIETIILILFYIKLISTKTTYEELKLHFWYCE